MQQLLFIAGLFSIIFGVYSFFKYQRKTGFYGLFAGVLLIASAYLTVYIKENSNKSINKTETFIKIAGSKTIGQHLMPSLVKEFLEKRAYKVIDQKEVSEKFSISASKIEKNTENIIHFEIFITGSVKGFELLKDNECDISMASTAMDDETKAKFAGFTPEKNEIIIAYDAIRIIGHPSKSEIVKSLEIKTLEDILQGKISDWRSINPKLNGDIGICLRDSNSGTYKFIEEKFFSQTDSIRAKIKQLDYFEKIAAKISEDSSFIGLIDFAVDSVILQGNYTISISTDSSISYPSFNTISESVYPLSRPLILYSKGENKNKVIADFLDFCKSDTASEIVKKWGFVPVKSE